MARKQTNPAKRHADKSSARKLTPKQELFVKEYLIDLNGTQAAIRAGYSAKTASRIAAELLGKTQVAEAVAAAKNARAERTDINADRVLKEIARLAFLDIGKAFDEGGNLKPLHEMDEDTRRAIAGLEVTALQHEGIKIGTLSKIKLADKLSALEKLGKHLGLFDQKVKVESDGDTLSILIQAVQGSSFKPVQQPKDDDGDEE